MDTAQALREIKKRSLRRTTQISVCIIAVCASLIGLEHALPTIAPYTHNDAIENFATFLHYKDKTELRRLADAAAVYGGALKDRSTCRDYLLRNQDWLSAENDSVERTIREGRIECDDVDGDDAGALAEAELYARDYRGLPENELKQFYVSPPSIHQESLAYMSLVVMAVETKNTNLATILVNADRARAGSGKGTVAGAFLSLAKRHCTQARRPVQLYSFACEYQSAEGADAGKHR